MSSLSSTTISVESFTRGQHVQTSFGRGVVSAISYVDAIIYVTLSAAPEPLYLLRPEQVEAIEADSHTR